MEFPQFPQDSPVTSCCRDVVLLYTAFHSRKDLANASAGSSLDPVSRPSFSPAD
jgi:hypothetical protein